MGERKKETVKDREREREIRREYENREGKEKSLKKNVPKLYIFNECEHFVMPSYFVTDKVSYGGIHS